VDEVIAIHASNVAAIDWVSGAWPALFNAGDVVHTDKESFVAGAGRYKETGDKFPNVKHVSLLDPLIVLYETTAFG
jgi:hypothetical protein